MLRVKLWAAFAFLGLLLILFLPLVSAGVTGTSEESGVPPTAETVTNKTQEGERSGADSEERKGENWRTAKQWGVRFFRWIVIPLAVLMLIALTILLYNRGRITLKGLGAIFLVVIVISSLAVLGHKTYKWWLSRPAATLSAIPDERSADARGLPETRSRTERATTKTIIARPDGSETISIPPNHWFRCLPQEGCIEGRTRRGYTWKECPGEGGPHLGNRIQVLDSMLSFRSLEEGNVDVICDWEPK